MFKKIQNFLYSDMMFNIFFSSFAIAFRVFHTWRISHRWAKYLTVIALWIQTSARAVIVSEGLWISQCHPIYTSKVSHISRTMLCWALEQHSPSPSLSLMSFPRSAVYFAMCRSWLWPRSCMHWRAPTDSCLRAFQCARLQYSFESLHVDAFKSAGDSMIQSFASGWAGSTQGGYSQGLHGCTWQGIRSRAWASMPVCAMVSVRMRWQCKKRHIRRACRCCWCWHGKAVPARVHTCVMNGKLSPSIETSAYRRRRNHDDDDDDDENLYCQDAKHGHDHKNQANIDHHHDHHHHVRSNYDYHHDHQQVHGHTQNGKSWQ